MMQKNVILSVFIIALAFGGYYFFTHRASGVKEKNTLDQLTRLPLETSNQKQTQTEPQASQQSSTQNTTVINKKIMNATLHTNKGDITLEFFDTKTPNTVANFLRLAQAGFYDGVKFHRVIADFMIQGGDPLTKDDSKSAQWGTGGPGYTVPDEIHADNRNDIGTISMANAGPNTNGSQFFINLKDNAFLDQKHTVFGKVVAGLEVVKAIGTTATDPNDRPLSPVIIQSITLK